MIEWEETKLEMEKDRGGRKRKKSRGRRKRQSPVAGSSPKSPLLDTVAGDITFDWNFVGSSKQYSRYMHIYQTKAA